MQRSIRLSLLCELLFALRSLKRIKSKGKKQNQEGIGTARKLDCRTLPQLLGSTCKARGAELKAEAQFDQLTIGKEFLCVEARLVSRSATACCDRLGLRSSNSWWL